MNDVRANQTQFLAYFVPRECTCASLFRTDPDDQPLLSFVSMKDRVMFSRSEVADLRDALKVLTRASSEDSVQSLISRNPIKGIGGKDVLVGLLAHLKAAGFECGRAWSAKSTNATLARCLVQVRNGAAYKADQPAPSGLVRHRDEGGAATGMDERTAYRSALRSKAVNVLKAECKDCGIKRSGKKDELIDWLVAKRFRGDGVPSAGRQAEREYTEALIVERRVSGWERQPVPDAKRQPVWRPLRSGDRRKADVARVIVAERTRVTRGEVSTIVQQRTECPPVAGALAALLAGAAATGQLNAAVMTMGACPQCGRWRRTSTVLMARCIMRDRSAGAIGANTMLTWRCWPRDTQRVLRLWRCLFRPTRRECAWWPKELPVPTPLWSHGRHERPDFASQALTTC
jgi:hypothetical protein